MFNYFLQGLFTEHPALIKALGLAMFVFMPYTLKEASLCSLRFSLFYSSMVGLGLLCRSYFDGPLFFLAFMAGIHGLLSLTLNLLLPSTIFEPKITGIIKRGDALAFLCFAAALEKSLPAAASLIFTLGGILGVVFLLILMAAFWEAFNLHRMSALRSSAWRMAVLAILSFFIS